MISNYLTYLSALWVHVCLLWSVHKTCGINLAITDAGYSPGTYHNMPGELQATIQLYDHSRVAGVCAFHLSFDETIIKNVRNRIKIVDTPEELGRWWLKMPGDQTKALRTSQQQWSIESAMIDRPTLGDASYNGAVESTNGMTSAVESTNTMLYRLAYLRQEERLFCCFSICINAVD